MKTKLKERDYTKQLKRTETDIKHSIKQWLDLQQAQGKLFHFHLLQGLGCYPGLPDRVVMLPNGITVWLEIKKDVTCKLSPYQEEFRKHCQDLGHKYIIVFGLDDCITNIEHFMKEE